MNLPRAFPPLLIFGVVAIALVQPLAWKLAGAESKSFENRPLSPAPRFAVSRLLKASLYDEISQFIEERNPLRWYAVVGVARLRFMLSGEIVNHARSGRVRSGLNGWLFIEESLKQQCWKRSQLMPGLASLKRIQDDLAARGKTMVFTVAPNKAAVYPELLGRTLTKLAECATASRELLTSLLTETGLRTVDALAALNRVRRTEQRQLYSPLDTHWNELGSLYFTTELAKAIPALESHKNNFKLAGVSKRLPDLSRLSGLFFEEQAATLTYDLPGKYSRQGEEIVHGGKGRPYVRQRATSTEMPLDKRKVLILHDSFFYVTWSHIAQYFEDVLYVHWTAFDPETFAKLAMHADIVIIQSVEREVYHRLTTVLPQTPVGTSMQSTP